MSNIQRQAPFIDRKCIKPENLKTFELWHKAIEAKKPSLIYKRLSKECEFHSPTVHRPFPGPAAMVIVLEAIMDIAKDTFYYER